MIPGNMYSKGYGVTQDYVRAHMWFNLSAVGSPPGEFRDKAAKNRDIVAGRMTPAQVSEALARAWRHGSARPGRTVSRAR